MRSIVIAFALIGLMVLPANTRAFETLAKAAIMIDFRNGDVLFAKNADLRIPPASMSKLMTALMVFEELDRGSLALDQDLTVSEKAWRMGGSRMYVEVGHKVSVENLLKGIIVQSGNDASVVVAEAIAGTEEAFAELMNVRARELGLENSNFANSTGLPDENHYMSVRDLAMIARHIISEHPERYPYYSVRSFKYNDIEQSNRNPLLQNNVPGVDGMKTGYTREAGYGLVSSAERDGRRIILVVAGLETRGQRRRQSERLMEYGFRAFSELKLFEAGETVVEVPVWHGRAESIALVPESTVGMTIEKGSTDGIDVQLQYKTPIPAPVTEGQELGELIIDRSGKGSVSIPLVASESVEKAGIIGRMAGTFSYIIGGSSDPNAQP